MVHKFIHFSNMLPDAVSEMFCANAQVHNYDARHKKTSIHSKQRPNLMVKKTTAYQGRTCWNTLPHNLK